MTAITPEELVAWRKLCEAATSGPWTREKPGRDENGFALGVGVAATYGRQMIYATPPGGSFPSADADFIAAARTGWSRCLDEIERLQGLVDQAAKALNLHIAYEQQPADRGGREGPKGLARQAFIDARDATLAKLRGES